MPFRENKLTGRLRRLLQRTLLSQDPIPARYLLIRALDRRFGIVKTYQRKLDYGTIERAHYGHCMLQSAMLARKLGHSRMSCIEFGVNRRWNGTPYRHPKGTPLSGGFGR